LWFEGGGGSEVRHHLIDFDAVDRGVIPAHPVAGLFAAALIEQRHQVLIGAALFSGTIQTLIVLNPEGDVPGFVICPTVVGGVGGEVVDGGAHRGSFELKSV